MSKRKASEANRGSSAKRSSSSSAALALRFDLAASNPKAIASALLSLLPDGATKQHNGAKNLLKAFDLIRAELDHNANKLVRKAEASGATKDFFFLDGQVKMPEDVFLHMLEYLPKPFLVHKASLICKPWLSATKTPCLWSELDIDAGLPKEMNMSTLLKLMARSQFSCLKTLILPGKARFTKASPPKNLSQLCPLLEEIDVGYARYTVDPSDEQLVALPNHFPHLRKIRFNMWKVTNVGISSLSESMADRLLDLRIKGYTSLNYAGRTLSDSTLIQVANVCPNLERFDYWISLQHHVPENDALSEIGVMALLRSCTKLKHLSLIDTKKVGLAAFEFIANANGSHLRHLDVEGVPSLFGHNAGRVRSRLEEHIEETIIRVSSERFRQWHFRQGIQ
jgi:hypothetical protein